MSFNTENINIGDKVICYSVNTEDSIGIVKKKTPKGFADVDFGRYTIRFDKYGKGKNGSGCTRKFLKYYTEEEEENIKKQERRKSLLRRIDCCRMRGFSLESLEKIWEICQKEMEKKLDGDIIV